MLEDKNGKEEVRFFITKDKRTLSTTTEGTCAVEFEAAHADSLPAKRGLYIKN